MPVARHVIIRGHIDVATTTTTTATTAAISSKPWDQLEGENMLMIWMASGIDITLNHCPQVTLM